MWLSSSPDRGSGCRQWVVALERMSLTLRTVFSSADAMVGIFVVSELRSLEEGFGDDAEP